MTAIPLGPLWNTFYLPAYNCRYSDMKYPEWFWDPDNNCDPDTKYNRAKYSMYRNQFSRTMAPGFAWNKVHDGTQTAFGFWSILFGIAAETLYLPCILALRQQKNSCFRIMLTLAMLDMISLPVSALIFGVGLILGEVYCSHPTFHFFLGAFGLGAWCSTSMVVLILAVNRVCELLGKSWIFKYVFINILHAVNNIAVVFFSSAVYGLLCLVVMMKQGALRTEKGMKRMKASYSVFLQAGLIILFNLVSSSIYVYMNFFYTPLWLIQVAQLMWQFAQGMPPVIYLALNKTIRRFAQNMLATGSQVQQMTTMSQASMRQRISTKDSDI